MHLTVSSYIFHESKKIISDHCNQLSNSKNMLHNKFRFFFAIIAVIVLLVVVLFLKNKNSAAESNREEITIVLNDIAAHAQIHYKRTNSFAGWVIPGSLRTEDVGIFREKVESDKVTIYVVGKVAGENGISNVNIKSIITGNNAVIKIRN